MYVQETGVRLTCLTGHQNAHFYFLGSLLSMDGFRPLAYCERLHMPFSPPSHPASEFGETETVADVMCSAETYTTLRFGMTDYRDVNNVLFTASFAVT